MSRSTTATATRAWPIPRRVLVATDASSASLGAERAGIDLAARSGASLIVLSVIDPSRLRLPGGLFHTRVDQVRARREEALAGVVDGARRRGVPSQYLIWEGDPGSGVLEAAEAEGTDVIVVGSHARGPVGRLLLGSVSAHVVEYARCPVIVIRPGQRLDDVSPGPSLGRADQPRMSLASARSTSAAVTPAASKNAGLG